VKKNFINEVKDSVADIFCIQETKAQNDQVAEALSSLQDYHINTHSAVKKGYSGVSNISKNAPLAIRRGIDKKESDLGQGICKFPKEGKKAQTCDRYRRF